MTRVLVTGAAGFLGRWFVKAHLALGDEVVGVDDKSSQYAVWPGELTEKNRVGLDAGLFFEADTRPFDIAYHFAAPVGGRLKIEGDPMYNADSLRLDSQFFRWAIKHTGIAVYPSSSAVYGIQLQAGNGRLLNEGFFHPDNPNWLAPDEMYGFTKLVGEMLAFKAEKYGLNTLCIRPFSGYGEGQSLEYPVPSICQRAKNKENPLVVWGTGQQKRDFIHVEDLVAATLARLDAGIQGYQNMNISSGWGTSFMDVAHLAAMIVGYKPEIQVDLDKPSGVTTRRGDPQKMLHYYTPRISLSQGLTRVIENL